MLGLKAYTSMFGLHLFLLPPYTLLYSRRDRVFSSAVTFAVCLDPEGEEANTRMGCICTSWPMLIGKGATEKQPCQDPVMVWVV